MDARAEPGMRRVPLRRARAYGVAIALAGIAGAAATIMVLVLSGALAGWSRLLLWLAVAVFLGGAIRRLAIELSSRASRAARAERYLRGEGAVALALADADDLFEGLERALVTLGEAFGSSFGAIWRLEHGRSLSMVSSWRPSDEVAPTYAVATAALSLGPGVDLAGRSIRDAQPIWTADVGAEQGARRSAAARKDGLRGCLAIPVIDEDALVAVLELVGRERLDESAQLAETLRAIEHQLNQFVARQRAESDAIASAENIAAVLDATRELSRSAHAAGARNAICEAALKVTGGALAALYEPDPSGRELRPSAVVGGLADTVRDSVLALDGGRAGEVRAHAGASELFVGLAPGSDAVSDSLVVGGARSCHYQPVVRDGRAIGVLTIAWSRPLRSLPERTASMLRLLAAEAAVAVERADLLMRLEAVARTDDLTGLGNRRAWDEQLALELARAQRAGTQTCVAMLDLDHFKAFNDELGHQAGDRLLKAAASAWRAQLRSTDTLTRYGGEEFAAVLPLCSLEDALSLIERVRQVTPAGQTCSGGVASWDGEETSDALVARADAALYEAKHFGRNRVVVSE